MLHDFEMKKAVEKLVKKIIATYEASSDCSIFNTVDTVIGSIACTTNLYRHEIIIIRSEFSDEKVKISLEENGRWKILGVGLRDSKSKIDAEWSCEFNGVDPFGRNVDFFDFVEQLFNSFDRLRDSREPYTVQPYPACGAECLEEENEIEKNGCNTFISNQKVKLNETETTEKNEDEEEEC